MNITNFLEKNYNINSPLDQFEVRDLISLDIPVLFGAHLSLTNIGLYISLAGLAGMLLNITAINNKIVFSN
jgi:F-type H+-transporting ATPase subunit a